MISKHFDIHEEKMLKNSITSITFEFECPFTPVLNFELQIQQLISFFTSWIAFICYEISIASTTFKCCICNNIFEKAIHERKKIFNCWICNYKFSNWMFSSFHELLFSKILLQIQHLNDMKKILIFSFIYVFSEIQIENFLPFMNWLFRKWYYKHNI